jgi:hypothetical protein
MRRLLILLVGLLSGCAVYDAYMMTGFDGNEYQLIVQIRVDANKFSKQCKTDLAAANSQQIAYETTMFEVYSEQIPHNNNGYGASRSLNEIAQGLAARYNTGTPVPELFCKLKYGAIEHSAEVIQHVIGARPR